MDRVRLKVLGLSYSMSQAGAYALILSDEQDMHRIPIVIGMPEAQSIAIQLEHIHTKRPLTHDLIRELADALGVTLKEVFIYRLEAGIFYSELMFGKEKSVFKIDSRTSDAIALALRYECPIYSTADIVEKAGIVVGKEDSMRDEPTTVVQTVESEEDAMQNLSEQELTNLLEDAVKHEDYEKASRIRDIMKGKR